MTSSRLVVSMGCPSGIGPEVSVSAALASHARALIVGDHQTLVEAAELRGLDSRRLVLVESADAGFGLPPGQVGVLETVAPLSLSERLPGAPSRAAGAAQLSWIDASCDIVSSKRADALVTAPVSKKVIVDSRAPTSASFKGHTEHLQERLGAKEVVMAFYSPNFTTALVTTHIPIREVAAKLTVAGVSRATYWLARLLRRLEGADAEVRVAVAGLNPHAGEGGLLGDEELVVIAQGIIDARVRLGDDCVRATISGPVPAESAFRLMKGGAFDGVVAMYHDQATIPMKLASFGDAVNVSLGLPIIRTSVDHGTAYDRAWKEPADARGMVTAMDLAERLALSRG